MPTCFVIMPFGQTSAKHTEEYWTEHFAHFIKPAIEGAADGQQRLGYQAMIANPPGGAISDVVFKHLQEADVVLADLTDFSPNVMYELGIRHCLHDRTIMIIEKGQTIPFYFRNYKVIAYSGSTNRDRTDFNESIQRYLLDTMHHRQRPSDNPVSNYFRGTGQSIRLVANHTPEIPTFHKHGFSAIYVPETNNQRNARKQQVLQEAKQSIDLLASSGHAYLVMAGSRFRGTLEQRLRAGIPTRIILSNPWSESKVLFALDELSQDTAPLSPMQEQALTQMKQGHLAGFDPVALIEQSIHYREKYMPSIRGYENMQRQFGSKVELRFCAYPITATILLTENTGFFEPYIHADLQERMRNSMITFELEFSETNYFYTHCKAYFDILWRMSQPYAEFVATQDIWKNQLRGKYEWKTNPPDSTT